VASIRRVSPVLQRRKAEQQAANNVAPAATAPVFNLSIGNEFANLLRRPAQAPPLAPALPLPPTARSFLLESSRLPGPDMTIKDFCHLYGLGDPVLQKFVNNGYAHAHMLRFVQLAELKEMEFLLGEIAAMKDAVERWSVLAQR
jgi:hypothetical protein